MKLYYSPSTCSLAPHIIIREAGLDAVLDRVTLDKDKRTTSAGGDYYKINPQGSVPALELDDGEVMTENAVILQYLATLAPQAKLAPAGGMELWRLRETLNFIATELHKGFSPLFRNPGPEVRESLVKNVLSRLKLLSGKLGDKPFLMGQSFSIADAYAFVTLRWAKKFEVNLSGTPNLLTYYDRVRTRPAVQRALQEEGLPTA